MHNFPRGQVETFTSFLVAMFCRFKVTWSLGSDKRRRLWLRIIPDKHHCTKVESTTVCRLTVKMAASPEGVKLQWDFTKDDISKRADELIEQSRKVFDAVGAIKQDELNFENCLKVEFITRVSNALCTWSTCFLEVLRLHFKIIFVLPCKPRQMWNNAMQTISQDFAKRLKNQERYVAQLTCGPINFRVPSLRKQMTQMNGTWKFVTDLDLIF